MKVNDLTPYRPFIVPPVTPPAGQIFQDTILNTTLLRVTDASMGSEFQNGYSAIYDMFNVDSSRFIFFGGGTNNCASLDVKNKTVSDKTQIAKNGAYYWSRIDPDTFYCIENWQTVKIWSYNFKKDKWTLIVDLTSQFNQPLVTQKGWADSRGMSWDDNRFGLSRTDNGNYYIYDVKLNKLIGPYTLLQAQTSGWKPNSADVAYLFGKSTMDSVGAVCYTADNQLIYNVETGTSFVADFGTPDNQYGDVHGDTGLGNRFVAGGGVASPGPNDGIYPFYVDINPSNLSSYLKPRKIIGPRISWGFDTHTSFRDATGKWATFILDGTLSGADVGNKTYTFDQEIFQLSVDSPPDGSVNRRICFHYSDSSKEGYPAMPKASQSQDNRVIGFNSTFGNGRVDLYLAFLDDVELKFTQDETRKLKNFADTLK